MIVMDGSMGSELLARRSDLVTGLWSAQYLIDAPELVKEIHLDYINAGADLIITNTYSTIPSYLSKQKAEDKMPELIHLAGKLAKEAVEGSKKKVKVAGSLPPLEESYRPDLVIDKEEAVPIYETLIKELTPYVKPEAYLFNCTDPFAITEGLKELKELTQKPIGGYPNVFNVPDGWTLDNDVQVSVRDLSVEKFLEFAKEWQNLGASIIGGCCGMGPEFIKAISALK